MSSLPSSSLSSNNNLIYLSSANFTLIETASSMSNNNSGFIYSSNEGFLRPPPATSTILATLLMASTTTEFANLTTMSLNGTTTGKSTSTGSVFESQLIIPLYVTIFLLAVVGNVLVLVTLVQNKRMRTVTNVYLLNLVSTYSSSTRLH